ncbi:surface carbohydrate biosynthesis protein [Halalkalibacter sp. APA_J-10(15)]|uniref:surface carbohydrate biosynthesis protein n=1 Tax=Halalkalibacter sp. APA_J-10(15) TaxID=2933805 RepID=UPI001FF36014|nr:surface carbohydrate biosynthesis protein [Halalkalibacter sp. APA_J-10(15)]MCK0470522.1 hypothetical protein [Halalkalibacter sp. APA_J-10(15)]
MSQRHLYLPIEVTTRELDGKLLLAYYAVKNGYNVVIGKQPKLFDNAAYLPKGIFFLKGYPNKNHFKQGTFSRIKKLGHALVELDEEGFIFNNNTYIHTRTTADHLQLLDGIFCWGKTQKNLLVQAYPHLKEKIHVTGHPRFDLLNVPFQSLYDDAVEQLKEKYGEFILVNTRFALYNHKNGMRHKTKHTFFKDLYDHFVEMVTLLSIRYPNVNVIIRPHPQENIASYQKEFKNASNVFVEHEGAIAKWIIASKLMVHNGCTTGIEAFLLEKPSITYRPIVSKAWDVELANAVSEEAASMKEIYKLVDKHLSQKKAGSSLKKKAILSSFYGNSGEVSSYERILHLLSKSSLKNVHPIQAPRVINNFPLQHKKNKTELTRKILSSFIATLNRIERTETNIVINKLDSNVFELKLANP